MRNNTAVIHNFRVASLSPSFLPSLLVTPVVSALSLAGNRPPQTLFWPMRRQCLRSSRLIPVENCSYQVAENSYEIHSNQPRARSVRFFRWICKCTHITYRKPASLFGLFSDGEALGSFPQWLAARARREREEDVFSLMER